MSRERVWPWLEGALLAASVLALLVLGGEAVRASYHGLLHASVGEAVLREGLAPENPYHAGAPLRYYTLYPALGVLLGRFAGGPLWGFALLDVLAALLLAPALDALGRRLGLGCAARRATFLAAALGFNGLGWIGLVASSGEDWGAPPVYVLGAMTFMREGFGWDARLQAFLPKFLNVSSYALALPCALWALSAARARVAWFPLGLALALNPLVGGFAGLVLASWRLLEARAAGLRATLAWALAGTAAAALALPFLLPSFAPAPDGPSLIGNPALGGSPWANLLGPQHLVLVPAFLGLLLLARAERAKLLVPIVLASALVLVGEMPQGNEYKMARLLGLVLALPAGVWLAARWARGRAPRIALAALALLTLPTAGAVARAYLEYGRRAPRPELDVLEAAASSPREAVAVCPPRSAGRSLVQGNPLAPRLGHTLYADLPQIHNEGQPDLAERLDELTRFFAPDPHGAAAALERMRERFPGRPLVFLEAHAAQAGLLREAGAQDLGEGVWLLPARATGH